MSYWHPERQVVYLASPRTASQATAKLLIDEFGFMEDGTHHSGSALAGRRGWHVVTTVRNHFDALVSWAHHAGFLPFDGRALSQLFGRMGWIPGRLFPHVDAATELLRYETLEADLGELLGEGIVSLPLVNSSGREPGDFLELYTPAMRARVEREFGDEMARLGYRWPVDPASSSGVSSECSDQETK